MLDANNGSDLIQEFRKGHRSDVSFLSGNPSGTIDAGWGDAGYDAIVGAGDAVVPSLIQKITDLTPIRDPRYLFSERTTVGDVAYFVLVDITNLGFAELLPVDVQKKIQTNGV